MRCISSRLIFCSATRVTLCVVVFLPLAFYREYDDNKKCGFRSEVVELCAIGEYPSFHRDQADVRGLNNDKLYFTSNADSAVDGGGYSVPYFVSARCPRVKCASGATTAVGVFLTWWYILVN